MGNIYDYLADLIGYVVSSAGSSYQNSNIIICACICVIVLFVVCIKLIFRGFDRLFGYHYL